MLILLCKYASAIAVAAVVRHPKMEKLVTKSQNLPFLLLQDRIYRLIGLHYRAMPSVGFFFLVPGVVHLSSACLLLV
jgi:hypothetical protein